MRELTVRRGAAQRQTCNDVDQALKLHRLVEEEVGARAKTGGPPVRRRIVRQHHDNDLLARGSQRFEHLDPEAPRHVNIDDDDIRRRHLDGAPDVGRTRHSIHTPDARERRDHLHETSTNRDGIVHKQYVRRTDLR